MAMVLAAAAAVLRHGAVKMEVMAEQDLLLLYITAHLLSPLYPVRLHVLLSLLEQQQTFIQQLMLMEIQQHVLSQLLLIRLQFQQSFVLLTLHSIPIMEYVPIQIHQQL
jgi:hypothetical protein